MNKSHKIAVVALLAGSVLASAVAPASAKVNEYEGQHRNGIVAGQPEWKINEYEGQHKVNEYEGQHGIVDAGQWNVIDLGGRAY